MSDQSAFENRLTDLYGRWVELAPTGVNPRAAAAVAIQRARQTSTRRWPRLVPPGRTLLSFAVVGLIVALAGTALFVGSRLKPPPSPTAPVVPSTSPSVAPAESAFTSPEYGYSVTIPSSWTVTAATEQWPGGDGIEGSDPPFADNFHAQPAGGVRVKASAVPMGSTPSDWLGELRGRRVIGGRCFGSGTDWAQTTVAGLPAWTFSWRCDNASITEPNFDEYMFVAGNSVFVIGGTPALLPIVLASFAGPPGGTAQQPECLGIAAGTSVATTFDVDGQSRQATVHVPASTGSTVPYPVVLMFHGYVESSAVAEEVSGLSDKADDAGFVVVYPQAAGEAAKWDVGGDKDTAFVESILTRLATDNCVDTSHVYTAGFSMGGGMAVAVGCRMADRIAGVASVSGVYGANWADPCRPARPVPLVVFHGLIDPQVPYSGGAIDDGSNPDLPSVTGVEDWTSAWAIRNGCPANGLNQDPIGKVEPIFWQPCAAPVHLYRILDGGHTWPGSNSVEPQTNRDISATDLIWEFVRAFDAVD